jgi:hypothetical protein
MKKIKLTSNQPTGYCILYQDIAVPNLIPKCYLRISHFAYWVTLIKKRGRATGPCSTATSGVVKSAYCSCTRCNQRDRRARGANAERCRLSGKRRAQPRATDPEAPQPKLRVAGPPQPRLHPCKRESLRSFAMRRILHSAHSLLFGETRDRSRRCDKSLTRRKRWTVTKHMSSKYQ